MGRDDTHRILVVPSHLIHEFRRAAMSRSSFTLRSAQSPEAGLTIAGEWRPHLVVFDSGMQGMSATQFSAALRDSSDELGPKLLMLTAHFGDSADDLTEVGCDAHLIAPFDADHLAQTVGALLNVRSGRGERATVELLAEVEDHPSDGETANAQYANIVELGTRGLMIECEDHLTIGAIDTVKFFLPGRSERVVVSCVVLFADELRMRYAGEFIEVPADAGDAISRFVAAEVAKRGSG